MTVGSAGLRALVGEPIDLPSARALARLGVDPDGHRARWYEDVMGEAATLVLTAEADQREVLLRSQPRLLRRTFTMKEFGRLGAALDAPAPAESIADRVSRIAAVRGTLDPIEATADDVIDPFGRGSRAARDCVTDLAGTTDRVAAMLGWPESGRVAEPQQPREDQ